MTLLVTGGAGYIGANVVRLAAGAGHEVVVVDDLSTGSPERVGTVPLHRLDIADPGAAGPLATLMTDHRVSAVIHLAGRKQVAESMERPAWYVQQNVTGIATLLEAMRNAGVGELVFSSSAAVYGDPVADVVDEESSTVPVSPYGTTKLLGEWLVRDAVRAWGLRGVSLRYFNVAGAGWPDLGDQGVTNLVTLTLARLAAGEPPLVYGNDYPTPDGTCVRDYVHVLDLADAHLAALEYVAGAERPHDTFNVGTGRGSSVLEVVHGLAAVTGLAVEPRMVDRRPADPPCFVASAERIAQVLGWRARSGLPEILASAWEAWRPGPAPGPAPRR